MSEQIAAPNIKNIPLNQLHIHPLNVRHTHDPGNQADVELIDSIRTHGLLQPLMVIQDKEDPSRYLVIGGGRRLVALQHLASHREPGYQAFTKDMLVACNVREEDSAEILISESAAENMIRENLHPVDEYRLVQQLVEDIEMSDTEAARHLSIPVKRVRQAMRLAHVAPEILDAFKAGELTVDQVQAFGITDNQTLQLSTYKELKRGYGDFKHQRPDTIRAMVFPEGVKADSSKARLVGDLYADAGGRFTDDLFSDEQELLDGDLLESLVRDLLEKKKQDLLKQGYGWVETTGTAYHQLAWLEKGDGKKKADRAGLGCVVMIDNGKLKVVKNLQKEQRAKKQAEAAENGEEIDPKDKPISAKLRAQLDDTRAELSRAYLTRDYQMAEDLLNFHLVHQMCLNASMHNWVEPVLDLGSRNSHIQSQPELMERLAGMDVPAGLKSDDLGKAWSAWDTASSVIRSQLPLIAIASTLTTNGLLALVASDDSLGPALGVDDYHTMWRPTYENFFSMLTKPQLLAYAEELFDEVWIQKHATGSKKKLATAMADAVANKPRLKGWLPYEMTEFQQED